MSMIICDDRHEPVVYTDYDNRNKFHKCPLCEVLDELAELRDDYGTLEVAHRDLKEENESLTKECEKYQQIIDADGGDR
uniref:Uncharacterized protein n=1 Tax=viral metagenome TaxID=1070528 RepID=A0A6M3L6G8_9ZZZZ